MPRTILYYPSITIQNPQWIRKAILYWDCIGTIIPSDFDERTHFSEDMKILQSEGLLRCFHPESYVEKNDELEQEFIDLQNSSGSHRLLKERPFYGKHLHSRTPAKIVGDQYRVYYGKFPDRLAHYLLDAGLATLDGHWLVLSRRDGLLYMSILAKYLANQDRRTITIPGTDYRAYQNLVFKSKSQTAGIPGLSFEMTNLLPVPKQNVPIQTILEFKAQRQQELSHFQEVIDQCQNQIRVAAEEDEMRDILINFQDRLKIEVEGLIKVFNEKRKSFILGAVENIIKTEAPILGSLALLGTISVPIVVTGAFVASVITLRKYQLDTNIAQHEILGSRSYAYLYSAYRAGIVNRP